VPALAKYEPRIFGQRAGRRELVLARFVAVVRRGLVDDLAIAALAPARDLELVLAPRFVLARELERLLLAGGADTPPVQLEPFADAFDTVELAMRAFFELEQRQASELTTRRQRRRRSRRATCRRARSR
jgi:hypothetical protein